MAKGVLGDMVADFEEDFGRDLSKRHFRIIFRDKDIEKIRRREENKARNVWMSSWRP